MFTTVFNTYSWDEIHRQIQAATADQVERVLSSSSPLKPEDFAVLISPAAAPYLEAMAQKSRALTLQRFGNTMQLFIPMYLSNECQNVCTYCGFSLGNKVKRKTLTEEELQKELSILKSWNYDQVLLVTGEDHLVAMDYFKKVLPIVRAQFSSIAMEVQPLETEEYAMLKEEGVHSVLLYQETYHKEEYKKHHPKGRKSNFDWRLEGPDRIGKAEIHKIGLGVLLGLEDWRTDSFYTAAHLDYLERTYWKTRYSVSFPRLRPFSGGLCPKVEMSDRELVQLICAWRIFKPEVELSLSTRESAVFRDHVMKLGITTMSAGSRTNPGGYLTEPDSLEQFEVEDTRTPQEIADMIRKQGYEVVWKDWDTVLG